MTDVDQIAADIRARLDEADRDRARAEALLAQVRLKPRRYFRNQRLLREARAIGMRVDALIRMNQLDLILLRHAGC